MEGGLMVNDMEGDEMEEDMPAPGGDDGMVQHEEELVPRTDVGSRRCCPLMPATSGAAGRVL